MSEPRESFDMDSGKVSIGNDLPQMDAGDMVQIRGRKFHIYDEENFEPFQKRDSRPKKD